LGYLIKKNYPDLAIDLRGDVRHIVAMFLGGAKYRVSYGITGGGFLLNLCPEYNKNLPEEEKNMNLVKAILASHKFPLVTYQLPGIYNHQSPYLNFTPEEELIDKFSLSGNKKNIIVHPLAGTPSKMWSIRKWEDLVNKILYKYEDNNLIIVGKDKVSSLSGLIGGIRSGERIKNLFNKTSLRDLVGLIKLSSLVISCDSGPAHIAHFLGKPLVLLASGTNRIERWFKENSTTKIIQKKVNCLDCQEEICPKDKHSCMELIAVEDVMEIVRWLMD
jgi:ADP-heptose:LPS heptosyltransferase